MSHRFGQVADGRFAIGDPQENAQVEGAQVLAVDRFQEAVEAHKCAVRLAMKEHEAAGVMAVLDLPAFVERVA